MAIPEEDITVDTSACNRTVRHTAFNKLSKASSGVTNLDTDKQTTDSDGSLSSAQQKFPMSYSTKASSSLLFKSRPLFQYVSSKNIANNIESKDSVPEIEFSPKSMLQLKNIKGPRKVSICLSFASSKAPSLANKAESLSDLQESSICNPANCSIAEYSVSDSMLDVNSSTNIKHHQNYSSDERTDSGCEDILNYLPTSIEEIVNQGRPNLRVPGSNLIRNVTKNPKTIYLKAKGKESSGLSKKDHGSPPHIMVTELPNEEGRKLRTFPKEQYRKPSYLSQQSEEESS